MQKLKQNQVATMLSKLIARQKNKCGICGHPFTNRDRAVMDHCHETGAIRGALHNSCNGTEGRLKAIGQRGHKGITSAKFIIGLGKYLEIHATPQFKYIYPTHESEDDKRIKRNTSARKKRAANKKRT